MDPTTLIIPWLRLILMVGMPTGCLLHHSITFLSHLEPEPPPLPPPVNETDIVPVLPPEESVVTVTLRFDPPEVTGGNIINYFVVLEAVGVRESRRKRQITLVEICTKTGVSNNFTVSPDTTQLDVDASMFNGNGICSMAHYYYYFFLSFIHSV